MKGMSFLAPREWGVYILFAVFIFFIFACSTQRPQGATQAEILFKEAEQSISKKRYIAALEKLNEIRTQHPYSFYATPAELLIADVKYLQENFVEAAADYQLFRDMHPKHEKIDYVIYRLAESQFNQMPSTFDRDLSIAEESVRYFQEIVNVYPQSQYVDTAKERIEHVYRQVRSREKYIADFYFKTRNYEAALWRYSYILDKLNDPQLNEHAKLRQVMSLNELGRIEECLSKAKEYATQLSQDNLKLLTQVVDGCGKKIKQEKQL